MRFVPLLFAVALVLLLPRAARADDGGAEGGADAAPDDDASVADAAVSDAETSADSGNGETDSGVGTVPVDASTGAAADAAIEAGTPDTGNGGGLAGCTVARGAGSRPADDGAPWGWLTIAGVAFVARSRRRAREVEAA